MVPPVVQMTSESSSLRRESMCASSVSSIGPITRTTCGTEPFQVRRQGRAQGVAHPAAAGRPRGQQLVTADHHARSGAGAPP